MACETLYNETRQCHQQAHQVCLKENCPQKAHQTQGGHMEPDAPTGQMVKAVLMDINVRGLQSPGVFARFLFEACKLVASDRVHAFTAQEHNLDPAREAELKRMCAQKHMTLTVAFRLKYPYTKRDSHVKTIYFMVRTCIFITI